MNPIVERYECVVACVHDPLTQSSTCSEGYYASAIFSIPESDWEDDNQRLTAKPSDAAKLEVKQYIANFILDNFPAAVPPVAPKTTDENKIDEVPMVKDLTFVPLAQRGDDAADVCMWWCPAATTHLVAKLVEEMAARPTCTQSPIVLLFSSSSASVEDSSSFADERLKLIRPEQSWETELKRRKRELWCDRTCVMLHPTVVRNRQPTVGAKCQVTAEGLLREVLFKIGIAPKYGA